MPVRFSIMVSVLGLAVACLAVNVAVAYEGAAPSLSGVGEALLRTPYIGNAEAADRCGVGRGEFVDDLTSAIKGNGLAVIPEKDARPPVMGMARIDLASEVVTLSNRSIGDCTSWVSLSAQTINTVRIPPIDAPRSVTVVYWKKGLLVSSGEAAHARAVAGAFAKLGQEFASQYRVDQPPALPALK